MINSALLRSCSSLDPEGDFLTYAEVRAQLHPSPAESSLVVCRIVTIRDPEGDEHVASVLRMDAVWGLL